MRAKRRVIIALIGALTLVMSGCARGGGDVDGLTLFNDKGAWTPYFVKMGEQSKKDIGQNMVPSGYTDEPTYQATIRSSFKTDISPDLFTWSTGPDLQDLAQRGQLADTSDIWRKAIADGDISPALEKDFTVNGKQYCVPLADSYWGMFYNKHIFAKYGLTVPQTWDQLMGIAQTLKSHGITAFQHTTTLFSFVWFQQILATSNPELYQRLSTGQASYTDPGVVAVLQRYRDMIKKGYMSDSGSKIEPAAQLKSGAVAMVPMGTFYGTTIAQGGMVQGKDFDYFPIPNVNPALKKTTLLYETGALCAPANANKLADSKKMMSWWLGRGAQAIWSTQRDEVSTNPQVKTTSPSVNAVASKANAGDYLLLNRYYDANPVPVVTTAIDSFGAFMVNPDSYLQQLQTIQGAAHDYWKEQR